ncbi:mediator of RNA polymerase II transcription subunit 9 [Passer montanus]|uniref:mediator of RNA polymerase II transcription subunit 9 n=1 Tax=Passer montanus TaxID=9160 RepID=UPI00196006E3|nr:mediator of RNA polymerase II transcription subunit 9 [Passer montanus]
MTNELSHTGDHWRFQGDHCSLSGITVRAQGTAPLPGPHGRPAPGSVRGTAAGSGGREAAVRRSHAGPAPLRHCRAAIASGPAGRAAEEPPPPEPPAEQKPPSLPPAQEEFSFLPLVHDIIKCMDKDSQDVHQVLNELKNKFQEMRKLISSMPGIGVSPEQQQQQLQNLREQVRTKNELLQKYKSLCMFEIPKE